MNSGIPDRPPASAAGPAGPPAGLARNLGCPSCGGVLRPPEGTRQIACGYCGGRFFLHGDWEARYLLPLNASRGKAQETVRATLAGMRKRRRAGARGQSGFATRARFAGARLYYIPFFRYSGLRVGTAPDNREDDVRTNTDLEVGDKGVVQAQTTLEVRYKVESKVVLAEVGLVLPALDFGADRARQWGLDRLVNERDFLSGRLPAGEPFRRESLSGRAIVLNPYRSADEVLAQCRDQFGYRKTTREADLSGGLYTAPDGQSRQRFAGWTRSAFGVETSYSMDHEAIAYGAGIVGDRVDLYWCPLWRIDLEYQDRRYAAFVDGTRGGLISLEVPSAGPPLPWRLWWTALAGGQLVGGVYWAVGNLPAFGGRDLFYGLAALVALGAAAGFYREMQRLEPAPAASTKVLYADDLAT